MEIIEDKNLSNILTIDLSKEEDGLLTVIVNISIFGENRKKDIRQSLIKYLQRYADEIVNSKNELTEI